MVRLRRGAFQLAVKFSAPGDGITVLFGPSGSGKTSVLSAVGALVASEGHILLGGCPLGDSAAGLWLPPHRRGIGLVFQDARLFPHLTTRQNIAYAFKRAPTQRRRAVGCMTLGQTAAEFH